jgi:hypothetical protein
MSPAQIFAHLLKSIDQIEDLLPAYETLSVDTGRSNVSNSAYLSLDYRMFTDIPVGNPAVWDSETISQIKVRISDHYLPEKYDASDLNFQVSGLWGLVLARICVSTGLPFSSKSARVEIVHSLPTILERLAVLRRDAAANDGDYGGLQQFDGQKRARRGREWNENDLIWWAGQLIGDGPYDEQREFGRLLANIAMQTAITKTDYLNEKGLTLDPDVIEAREHENRLAVAALLRGKSLLRDANDTQMKAALRGEYLPLPQEIAGSFLVHEKGMAGFGKPAKRDMLVLHRIAVTADGPNATPDSGPFAIGDRVAYIRRHDNAVFEKRVYPF